MNQEVLQYVQNQLVRAPQDLQTFTRDIDGQRLPQRYFFMTVDKYLRDFIAGKNNAIRWLIIPGLRGVGKTTILAQIFLKYARDISNLHMLYVSLDEVTGELEASLRDVMQAYETILGDTKKNRNQKLLIFIDEAQYDPQWGYVVKRIVEKNKNIFFICSGSSAISLQTNPESVRRASIEKLYPTSFCEFLMIRDKQYPTEQLKQQIKQSLFQAQTAQQSYNHLRSLESKVLQYWSRVDKRYIDEYLRVGTLPFASAVQNESRAFQMIQRLIDSVINKDIRALGRFDNDTLPMIKRILFIITMSDVVSAQGLAKALGTTPNTVGTILDALEKTELLIRVHPYGSSAKRVRKPSKYLFMSSAVRATYFSIAGTGQMYLQQKGRLMEDIAAMTLHREFVSKGFGELTHDSSQQAADFILTRTQDGSIPIEVGIGHKDLRQVKSTMKRVSDTKFGIVISNDDLGVYDNVIQVPLSYFLLI